MPRNSFRYFKTSHEIIQLAVMMYVRFPLSLRNVEDPLHERGIDICHESVRLWVDRFGPMFAGKIRFRRTSYMRQITQWQWHLDEVFVKINGETHYLWRAVDHEGEVLESYVTKTRDKSAALRFLKEAMKRYGSPRTITTDRLRSYSAAMKDIGNIARQKVDRHLNNRAENSHLPFRRRERAMSRFRRMSNLQKFASTHASFYNHFNLDRHINHRQSFKTKRDAAILEWRQLLTG
ncbi:MAG TPA: IS6 family transposase [Henriciella marina]|uniref:IS6 family transposase n=1 Tax=Henriciella sp. TaxID=1968823 RepID=UPI0017C08C3A|nr:IS6 family transposase [Henriciella sp.]HIG21788.1 IS6 family transposase [Henriciella sp.]HIK65242.1 IS6 family transposase [Henriciella marina]